MKALIDQFQAIWRSTTARPYVLLVAASVAALLATSALCCLWLVPSSSPPSIPSRLTQPPTPPPPLAVAPVAPPVVPAVPPVEVPLGPGEFRVPPEVAGTWRGGGTGPEPVSLTINARGLQVVYQPSHSHQDACEQSIPWVRFEPKLDNRETPYPGEWTGFFSYDDPDDLGQNGSHAKGVWLDTTRGGLHLNLFERFVPSVEGEFTCLLQATGAILERGPALPSRLGGLQAGSPGVALQPANGSRIPPDIVASAIGVEQFEQQLEGKEWVFFAHGVRDCDPELGQTSYLPPGDDEFARRAAAASRDAVRATLEGRVVRFEGSGTMEGSDAVFQTIAVGGQSGAFQLYRSAYDFRGGRFTFHVVANSEMSSSGANWGICRRGTCSPDIRPQTFRSQVMQTIGSFGGRDLEVERTASDTEWQNFSRISIPVPMEEAVARGYSDSMPVSLVIYMRFTGLGSHQRCQRSCSSIFGQVVCGGDDNGMGLFKRSQLLAYEVKVGGQVVADLVP